jgi:hypothetical protein
VKTRMVTDARQLNRNSPIDKAILCVHILPLHPVHLAADHCVGYISRLIAKYMICLQ